MRALTTAAVFFGRVITEGRAAVAVLRDPLFRLACRFPGLGFYLRDLRWFPITAYRSALLATPPGWVEPKTIVARRSANSRRIDRRADAR